MTKHLTMMSIILIILAMIGPAKADAAYRPAPESIIRAAHRTNPPPRSQPRKRIAWMICQIFTDDLCTPSINIAWCESTLNTRARNGQYRGLFQMGSSERRRFGHGRLAITQARAARRYYNISGWSPWECQG